MRFAVLFIPTAFAASALLAPRGNERTLRVPALRCARPSGVQRRDKKDSATAIWDGLGWDLPVTIGGQEVLLYLDTGSSDIWTSSTLMPKDQQSLVVGINIFDPKASKTFKYLEGAHYSIGYGDDGAGSAGLVGIDTVSIGGASVPNMPFGIARNLTTGQRTDAGLIGLGFGKENTIRPHPQPTFMEALEPYIDLPVFTTFMRSDSSGFVEFGAVDSRLHAGELTTIPIANASAVFDGQWGTHGVTFGTGGKAFDAAPTDFIFDTGGPDMAFNWEIAAAYFARVPGAVNTNGSNGTWTYPCRQGLPDLDITFSEVASGPRTVTVPGSYFEGEGRLNCTSHIDIYNGKRGNAGDPFYLSHYMIWNQSAPSLSFARQVADVPPPSATAGPDGAATVTVTQTVAPPTPTQTSTAAARPAPKMPRGAWYTTMMIALAASVL